MKQTLLAIALLGAFAGGAAAQSSVTVYGVLDTYYTHDSGGNPAGPVNAIDGGFASLSGTRLGFKGREALGDGLAVIFTAEMGFGGDTGAFDATGIGFGRQAFVGLQGKFGALKLGRQYNPLFNGGVRHDPFGGGLEGAYLRVISLGSGKRMSNAVLYSTPALASGWNAEVAYSLGEAAGRSDPGRAMAMNLGYTRGPFSANLVYNKHNNVPAGSAAMVTTRNTGFGASYKLGVVKLSGLYQVNTNNAGTGALDTSDLLAGAVFPFGASSLIASYILHRNQAIDNADTRQLAVGYTYSLSTRTTLYTSYARIANDGAASIATPGTPGGTNKQFNMGINHAF